MRKLSDNCGVEERSVHKTGCKGQIEKMGGFKGGFRAKMSNFRGHSPATRCHRRTSRIALKVVRNARDLGGAESQPRERNRPCSRRRTNCHAFRPQITQPRSGEISTRRILRKPMSIRSFVAENGAGLSAELLNAAAGDDFMVSCGLVPRSL